MTPSPGRRSEDAEGTRRRAARHLLDIATASWPLLQATAAVAVAWELAIRIGGHPAPFFAPIAAVIALNGPRGERGSQAVRMLAGVFLGIAVSEVVLVFTSGGEWWVVLAAFVAMAIARAAGASRIVIIQAAGSAILTVAAADGDAGVDRLIDAAIGSGVALVFSQVLFSPEPVALLRRAESEALHRIAHGLDLVASALEGDDSTRADAALDALRETRTQLGELARIRKASISVARHSAVWRSQIAPLVRERQNAGHLDLLGGGAVMVARTAIAAEAGERTILAAHIRELTAVLQDLAASPGDHATRQHAVDCTLELSVRITTDGKHDSGTPIAIAMLQILAIDLMIFSGLSAEEAAAAVLAGSMTIDVPAPPATPRIPFGLDRFAPDRRRPDQPGSTSPRKNPRRHSDRTDVDREQ